MSLNCILGLTACLSYGGNAIPAEEVVRALETCELVRGSVTNSRLEVVAETIEDAMEIRMSWPPRSSIRTKQVVIATECAKIQAAFNNRHLWTNYDKWPY